MPYPSADLTSKYPTPKKENVPLFCIHHWETGYSHSVSVAYSVTPPMNGREAAGDLVLIQTSLFLSVKLCCCDANYPACICILKAKRFVSKQGTGSLASSQVTQP